MKIARRAGGIIAGIASLSLSLGIGAGAASADSNKTHSISTRQASRMIVDSSERSITSEEADRLVAEGTPQSTLMRGITVSVNTTDSGAKGGRGHFVNQGDKPLACDTQADGKRVITYIYWNSGNQNRWSTIEDTNGANGDCMVRENVDLPEGTKVILKTCLKSGANGALEYCGINRNGVA
ncbi:hypothetical protein NCG97_14675 [Streptomyces lydicamycinicus]|uniref:Ricin B lectin domain-containing protein n=1 Tax=Streptomyces lydicamycinicus TaxID=1546107 RepID=A0A0P4R0T5_9ACTN|nr:hypothetical protein [Streptomyces lydicamycinicus]USA01643.1 hypothetical protein NCG97_14675 [Streptomyces lydicamycinicus]GAO05936.1 hypothetical protein TPA0598_01_03070 [Streptomyces lydicamycinicus]